MKVSIAVSILILLIAALIGVPRQQHLVALRKGHAELLANTSQRGIATDLSGSGHPVRTTKRERKDQESLDTLTVSRLIAFVKETAATQKNGDSSYETWVKQLSEIKDQMMLLNSTQLKLFIAEIRTLTDLKDVTRSRIIELAIVDLSKDYPQAALTLLVESSDVSAETASGQYVSSLLANWAKEDPLAAVGWVKNNSAKFPNLITARSKLGLISGIAARDPKLAFKLTGELEIKNLNRSISDLIGAAKTPEERTATLAALREHLATVNDDKARGELSAVALATLSNGLVSEKFETSSQWLARANLTPAELESFSAGIDVSGEGHENGKWIEWLGEKLPSEKANEQVRNHVTQWTQKDYRAAGEWLATAAPGPTKNNAIRSYAETIAEYEPTSAAQWALTLPPGQDRDVTLKIIYQKWPQDDSTAKEAFGQQHGIK